MQQRLATFELSSAELDDTGLEREWNSFVEGLLDLGLRPADEILRSTDTSMTFRVFDVAHEQIQHSLDFSLHKFGVPQ